MFIQIRVQVMCVFSFNCHLLVIESYPCVLVEGVFSQSNLYLANVSGLGCRNSLDLKSNIHDLYCIHCKKIVLTIVW